MRENARLMGSGGWMNGVNVTDPAQTEWLQNAYGPLLGSLWGQQQQGPAARPPAPEVDTSGRLSAKRASKSPSKTPTATSRRDSDSSTPNNADPRGSSTPKDWNRKARPKRGQYRKYDKNALDEAVRAVRSGEMSVHRAGSFYGVPHSTLEYKVKERNLLRTKKRKTGEEGVSTPNTPNTPCSPGLKDEEPKAKSEKVEEEGAWNLSSDMMKRLKEAAPTDLAPSHPAPISTN